MLMDDFRFFFFFLFNAFVVLIFEVQTEIL